MYTAVNQAVFENAFLIQRLFLAVLIEFSPQNDNEAPLNTRLYNGVCYLTYVWFSISMGTFSCLWSSKWVLEQLPLVYFYSVFH